MPTIERDGISLHFEELGGGEPLILGHSFLCDGSMWSPQLAALAQRFRVINPDFRGHGRSSPTDGPFSLDDLVKDHLAILDHLGIQRAHWAGLSIGGMVAMRSAIGSPERVASLALLNTVASAETTYKKIKYRFMSTGVRWVGFRPFLPAIVPLFFGATTLAGRPELVSEWTQRFVAQHIPSMLQFVETLVRRNSVVDQLAAIEVPTLVLGGKEDRSLPPPCSRQLNSAIAGSELVLLPGCGHLSTLERPEAVTSALMAFYGRVQSRRDRSE